MSGGRKASSSAGRAHRLSLATLHLPRSANGATAMPYLPPDFRTPRDRSRALVQADQTSAMSAQRQAGGLQLPKRRCLRHDTLGRPHLV